MLFTLGLQVSNKTKSKTYHTVGTIPESNENRRKRGKMDTPKIHIHDHSLSRVVVPATLLSISVNTHFTRFFFKFRNSEKTCLKLF
jgi:hypothetical protein